MKAAAAIIIACVTWPAAGVVTAEPVASVNNAIAEYESVLWRMQSYENPATRQWMLPISYSTIRAGYEQTKSKGSVDPQAGNGHSQIEIKADSYIKFRTSTLWGSAMYNNGIIRNVVWNESSDRETVGPYLIADDKGGNMRGEGYCFSGGYADHNDRWSWGVALGYTAGLYYRSIDPRPRNTTNRLDLTAGGSIRIGRSAYRAGFSVNYRKYKQTADLEFVNEMSDNQIWHLTGLGTHYERFESQGYSHYYDGDRFGAGIDLFPQTRRGFTVSAVWRHMSLDHILTSLNKLPLQTLTDNDVEIRGAWIAPGQEHDAGVSLGFVYRHRSGKENIFGDPSTGIYPKIGELDMYERRRFSVAVHGLWQWHMEAGTLLAVEPGVVFDSDVQNYVEPVRMVERHGLMPQVKVKASRGFGRLWRAMTEATFEASVPLNGTIRLPWDDSLPEGLQRMEINRAEVLSKFHSEYSLRGGVSRAITNRYAVALNLEGVYRSFCRSIHTSSISVSASFIF